MKKLLLLFVFVSVFATAQTITFTENKGQVSDQNYKPRPDVLYSGSSNGIVYHLRNNGISYQLNRVDSWKEEEGFKTKQKHKVPGQTTIYRLDINWLGINANYTTQQDKAKEGYNNYYLEVCPNGVTNVKTYEGVWYNNIYNNINLHYYEKNKSLKYDYIVAPGGNYKLIQLQINGADKIELQKDGSLVFTTPLGKIQEGAPLVYQNGKRLKAKWAVENNVLSFDIANYNPALELIIDPIVRLWGTYYGGSGYEEGMCCASGTNGYVYLSGRTASTTDIATIGGHQTSNGGGTWDAYLVKFDANGVRQWGTYYGGAGTDTGPACAADAYGNAYLAGIVAYNSGPVIATPGSHQSTFGGGNNDAFLVKFNAAGIRQWGTYYGGGAIDYFYSCTIDGSGYIYLAGLTNGFSTSGIATPGCHQPNFGGGSDAFLVKFNSSGVRQWGTYYGGAGNETGYSCSTDSSGNVYLAGLCDANTSYTAISTPGCHQLINNGNNDAFLVKFNSNGVRQWGTYYGGTLNDRAYSCAVDTSGSVYLAGYTNSDTIGNFISTIGSHQVSFGGYYDAFLVKFDSSGVRQWGTYYGGTSYDEAFSCSVDANNNIFLCGDAGSSTGTTIATPGNYQSTYAGNGADAFLVKFNTNGVRQWGTYYGGNDTDWGTCCIIGANSFAYLSGYTYSYIGTSIATASSHQPLYGGGVDAFLAKFDVCINAPPQPSPIHGNSTVCIGSTYTYSVPSIIGANSYSWNLPGSWIGTSTTNIITTTVSSSGGNIYVSAINSCGTSSIQTLSVAVNTSVPGMPGPISGLTSLCANSSATNYSVSPVSNAMSYIWNLAGGWSGSSASNIILALPGNTTTFSVTAVNSCGVSPPRLLNITVNSTPTVTVNNGVICYGQSFTILPVGANTYTFSGGTAIVSPTSNTSYTVVGTSTAGCISNVATSNVTVNPTPTLAVSLSPSSGSICPPPTASPAFLSVSGATSYTWIPGALVSSSPIVQPPVSTTYTVTGTDINGCTNTATQFLFVHPPSTLIVTPPSPLCSGSSVCFNTSGDLVIFNWNGPCGDISSSPNPCLMSNTSCGNTYTVGGTNANGCVATTTISITVNPLPMLNASSSTSLICTGQSATLIASGASTYTWNTGGISANEIITPTITTSYSVTGIDANGCSNVATITQSVSLCTGVQSSINMRQSSITILPNPNNGIFEVYTPNYPSTSSGYNLELEIINNLGQVIYQSTIINQKSDINLQNYSNGVYYVKITNALNETYYQKIILQK